MLLSYQTPKVFSVRKSETHKIHRISRRLFERHAVTKNPAITLMIVRL